MDTERDTHFAGFALAMFEDLDWNEINIDMDKVGWEERWITRIAQRAYDLACHVSTQTILSAHGDMTKIPDMAVLPEE